MPGWEHALAGEQLKMFMTPREIKNKYQVLDADREDVFPERGGEMTGRSETTAGAPNITANTALRKRWAGWHGGTEQVAGYNYARNEDYSSESDSQVWDRKLEESQLSPPDYAELHGAKTGGSQEHGPPGFETMGNQMASQAPSLPGHPDRRLTTQEWEDHDDAVASFDDRVAQRMGSAAGRWEDKYGPDAPSLYDKIASTPGGVTHPVHLGTDSRLGQEGKPMVYGGHHRIAAMGHLNQDQLIPVLHHEDFQTARYNQNPDSPFKYT